MTVPADDRISRIVKRLALMFALLVGLGLPAGYFGLQYSNHIKHVELTARLKAQSLSALVAVNPEFWVYQLQRLEELLLRNPPQLVDDRATIRDGAGNLLVALGARPPAPVIARSSPIYDSGRVVGEVRITHSYREVVFGTLIAALVGLLLGVLVYATVLVLPLRALRRVAAALVRESAAVSASASRYRALAEAANDAIITADSAGTIVGWNPAAQRMFGYTETEAVGQPLTLVIPPRYRDGHLNGIKRTQAGGERHVSGKSVELHGLTKAGREFPLELSLSEWEAPEGRDFAGVIQDITERKRAALALARQKDLYHMLSQTNQAIVRISSREELFSVICRVAVEHGRFRFAWIGLNGKDDKRLKPVARYGEDAGYIDQLNLAGDSANIQQGLTGQTLFSGTSVISNDFLNDPAMAPWHEAARRAGVRASAKFPIREGSAVIGAFSVYAGEPGFFTQDVLATLDEMALDVSFALDNYARDAWRRNMEEQLREGEDRYRRMFETNPEPMWVYDVGTLAFLAVNDSAVAHYGWSREEFLAMTVADLRPPDDTPALLEYVSVDSGITLLKNESVRHRMKDGTLIDVEITSHLIDFGGRRARIVSAHDVTERKGTERVLREAEEQFRGLVEQPIAGIYIIQDGRLAYVNPRFTEILGYDSAAELTGSDVLLVVAESERTAVSEKIRVWLKGDARSISYSTSALRKDGSSVEVDVHAARASHRGRPAIIGLMQDISEKKRAEEQIQHYVAQLENAFMQSVQIATTLSEMRDPYTAGHERRVAEIAVAIGAELGFDARRQEGLRVAGYLHDVGKIAVPTEILAKPGKLSTTEYLLIKGHAQASYDVLKSVEFPWPVADVALQHHERMDGSGYPQGLKGDAILLESRVVAVADVVEAMSSHRPYRPGLGIEKALAEIERGRGTVYDAEVADACLKLFREKGYVIPG